MNALKRIDPTVRLLLLAIALASILPATGTARPVAQTVSDGAVFLLFLLNGLRLPRTEVRRGIGHWRLLLPLLAWCFGAWALAGKGMASATGDWLPATVALGFLYLGVLPSTVQSATAYSSLAGGNVASSVVVAAVTNVLGVFVSVPLFVALGGTAGGEFGLSGLGKVLTVLVLPFAIGQVLQGALGRFVAEHRTLASWLDRISIAIAVYVAMSGAVEQGLWTRIGPVEWMVLLVGVCALLVAAFAGSWWLSGLLHLGRPDRIAFLFAGAHKSVAMGAPLAAALFPPAIAGTILLPLLIYHLLQLVVSAPIANRLARHPRPALDGAA